MVSSYSSVEILLLLLLTLWLTLVSSRGEVQADQEYNDFTVDDYDYEPLKEEISPPEPQNAPAEDNPPSYYEKLGRMMVAHKMARKMMQQQAKQGKGNVPNEAIAQSLVVSVSTVASSANHSGPLTPTEEIKAKNTNTAESPRQEAVTSSGTSMSTTGRVTKPFTDYAVTSVSHPKSGISPSTKKQRIVVFPPVHGSPLSLWPLWILLLVLCTGVCAIASTYCTIGSGPKGGKPGGSGGGVKGGDTEKGSDGTTSGDSRGKTVLLSQYTSSISSNHKTTGSSKTMAPPALSSKTPSGSGTSNGGQSVNSSVESSQPSSQQQQIATPSKYSNFKFDQKSVPLSQYTSSSQKSHANDRKMNIEGQAVAGSKANDTGTSGKSNVSAIAHAEDASGLAVSPANP